MSEQSLLMAPAVTKGGFKKKLKMKSPLTIDVRRPCPPYHSAGLGNPPSRVVDYVIKTAYKMPLTPTLDSDVFDPLEVEYETENIEQWPEQDRKDGQPPPSHIAMFCLPNGATLAGKQRAPTIHGFVLTDLDGTRVYGVTLMEWIEVEKQFLPAVEVTETGERQVYYSPICTTILSHWPFYDNFRTILVEYAKKTLSEKGDVDALAEKLEESVEVTTADEGSERPRAVTNPAPPSHLMELANKKLLRMPLPTVAGKDRVDLNVYETQIPFSLPPNDEPMSNFNLETLFNALDINNVVLLMRCVMLELRIVLLCSQLSVLTEVSEGIFLLMYPFQWQYVYIPVLPKTLIDYVSAPTPFIVGVHSSMSDKIRELSNDIVVVDLDANRVFIGSKMEASVTKAIEGVPQPETRVLVSDLRRMLRRPIMNADEVFPEWPSMDETRKEALVPKVFPEKGVRSVFLLYFAKLFCRYRQFLLFLEDSTAPIVIFNRATFLGTRVGQFKASAFLAEFIETQIFASFLEQFAMEYPNVFDKTIVSLNIDTQRPYFMEHWKTGPPVDNWENAMQTPSGVRTGPRMSMKTAVEIINLMSPRTYNLPRKHTVGARPKDALAEDQIEEEDLDFLQSTIRNLVNGVDLESIDHSRVVTLIQGEHGRDAFVEVMEEYCIMGTMVRLPDLAYDILSAWMNTVLVEMDAEKDNLSADIIRRSASIFYRDSAQDEDSAVSSTEFIQSRIKGAQVWKSARFWELAYEQALKFEIQKLYSVQQDEEMMHLIQLNDTDKAKTENVIFRLVGSFTCAMLHLGCDVEMAEEFVTKHCEDPRNSLTAHHIEALKSLIAKMFRTLKRASSTYTPGHTTPFEESDNQPPLVTSKSQTQLASVSLVERDRISRNWLQGKWVSRVFEGHEAEVDCVAIKPAASDDNGTYVVSASRDGFMRKWDAFTLDCLAVYAGHKGAITHMSHNIDYILTGSTDKDIRLWDWENAGSSLFSSKQKTKSSIKKFIGHEAPISFLSPIDEHGYFYSGSADKSVRVWSTDTSRTSLKALFHCKGHTDTITCAADSKFGGLATGSVDKTILLWKVPLDDADEKKTQTLTSGGCLKGHTDAVNKVLWMNDFQVASCSADKSIRLWNAVGGNVVETFVGHTGAVTHLNCINALLVSAADDGTMKVWDTRTGKCVADLPKHDEAVTCVAINGWRCVSGSSSSSILITDLRTNMLMKNLQVHNEAVTDLAISQHAQKMVSCSVDKSVRVYDFGL